MKNFPVCLSRGSDGQKAQRAHQHWRFGRKRNGEEWIYNLQKKEDRGGVPGQVRIFFPQSGLPKITSISL